MAMPIMMRRGLECSVVEAPAARPSIPTVWNEAMNAPH
jgi:hypothetical protein